jgi:hypothetical protein
LPWACFNFELKVGAITISAVRHVAVFSGGPEFY